MSAFRSSELDPIHVLFEQNLEPSQWFSAHGNGHWTSERRLMLGILESVGCILRHPMLKDYAEACEWLMDDDGGGLYSISNICGELGLNVVTSASCY